MEIKHPVFHHTDENEKIYAEYGELSPRLRLRSAFLYDTERGEYRIDRILARRGELHGDPNHGGNDDGDALLTRGRALYMFTHDPSVLGFGGVPSYCQPLEGESLMAVDITIGGEVVPLSEVKEKRVNAPSHWHGEYKAGSLYITADKYITEQNCAVLLYKIENRSEVTYELRVSISSPFARERWAIYPDDREQGELRLRFPDSGNLTTVTARMTASGAERLHREDTELSIPHTVAAGDSVNGYAMIAFTTVEIPQSDEEYKRLSSLLNDPAAALAEQKREYNEFWHKTVPYIDTPSASVNKAIDYRFWLERYNVLDANIPGYDYQYPVTIEGVLGYNNAIALTQCMHLDDTKWQRTARLPYGQLLSVGASSGGSAFLDNPGNRRCWNNHYGQYIAASGLEAFRVHGGDKKLALTLARWFEGDAKGQLEHYGNHTSPSTPPAKLIAYRSNYMTGNDADTVSMHYHGIGRYKMHAENAYVFGAAKAASDMYALAGDREKSREMAELAEDIRADILHYLWCEKCHAFETRAVEPGEDFVVHNEAQPNLVPHKECNSYNYFALGVPPTDPESLVKYREAYRHLADPEEFPIFPYYTASQRDNKENPGSNNFSNINFTVQARAYESALRVYDRDHKYVTPEMLSSMVEWCAWNMYPDGGDVRYPNNSEFFNADRAADPCGKGDYYRSWIYHNILGNYNYIFIEDMAGLRPRFDGVIELDPIDFGYTHFAVDNLRYHGRDISVFYNADGAYSDVPRGYSLYLDGEHAFTVSALSRVVYDPASGTIDADADVLFVTSRGALPSSLEVTPDTETSELLERAGLTGENLALGAHVEASYTPSRAREAMWAEKHRADGHDPTSRAENECAPDPAAVTDGIADCMPFWGNDGSGAEFDTLTLTLAAPATFDTLTAHFYDDRQNGGYSYPRRYLIEYCADGEWRPVTTRSQEPRYMCANRNVSRFDAITTDRVRVHFYNRQNHATAVTEIGLFHEGTPRIAVMNHAPLTYPHSRDIGGLRAALAVEVIDDGMPFDRELSCRWSIDGTPQGAVAVIENETSPDTTMTVSEPGVYYVTLHVTDGEIRRNCSHAVEIASHADELYDTAPEASVTVDFCTDWENKDGVNDPKNEPTSSNMGTGRGWGTWGSRNDTHTLTLRWERPVTVDSADIFWYSDGGGIRLPAGFTIESETADGVFTPVSMKSSVSDALIADRYNRVEFGAVRTCALRVVVRCGEGAVGIYRLKTYAPKIEELPAVLCAVKSGDRPSLPATVTVYSPEGDPAELSVTWFTETLDTSADGVYTVSGVASPVPYRLTATVYARGDMDSAVITEADVVTAAARAGEIPSLPTTATVHFNNGSADNISYRVIWTDGAKAPRSHGEHVIADAGVIEGTDIHITLRLNVI